ncbi:hypothetical protein OHA37_21130 [Streptomyces sp. NBC_00335]|uniref:hypothetical protein n=1 Tax=unclassified Streptomyces TaxID=2593676 RepID=UPI002252CB04|nr:MULTISPECIES: hypothetical protein [unclassified Streptomyces]MCX5406366.1 hypothetical protein [Streptomyces sp. NBC_00086]
MEESQKVSGQQWAWGVAGVAAAGAAAVLGIAMSQLLGGFFFTTAIVTAAPLLMRGGPKAFARTCLLIGSGLIAWSVIGALIGMFFFLPAAVLLLIAAFVDPQNRPGTRFSVAAPLMAAASFALIALPLFFPSAHDSEANEPPPYFSAKLDGENDRDRSQEVDGYKERLRPFGATQVEVGEYAGELKLHVGMPKHFPEEGGREALKAEISRIPGVSAVRFCTFHTCDD